MRRQRPPDQNEGCSFDWLGCEEARDRGDSAVPGSMKMTHRNEVARWIEANGGGFAAALAVLRQQISPT